MALRGRDKAQVPVELAVAPQIKKATGRYNPLFAQEKALPTFPAL